MDLKESQILGNISENHWYYIAKSRAVVQALSPIDFTTFFDIGAGDGFFSKKVLNSFTNVKEAWCIDNNYEENSSFVINDKKINFQISPPDDIHPDLYIFMDVLEHIEDDFSFLSMFTKTARKNTYFFFSVPAFPFLWSSHDEFLEHKRRYTLKSLEELVKKSGLTIMASHYYFAAVFPLAATMRIFSKLFNSKPASQLKRHSLLVNKLLLHASLPELAFSRYNRLFGLSILCLARK